MAMPPPPAVPSAKSLGKRKAEGELVIRDAKLPLSINRQKILDEDIYADAISRIIKRDFFPELYERDMEKERMDRLRSAQGMFEAGWTLPESHREAVNSDATSRSSRYAQTPMTATTSALPPAQKEEKLYDDSLSLSKFLERYTSEDNASFAAILDKENDARIVKHKWAFDAERKANEKEKRQRIAREALVEGIRAAIEASETGEVNLIEGVEAGRPGERLVLEPGRTSILGDKASIQQARMRAIAPMEDRKLLTGPEASTSTENAGSQLDQALVKSAEETSKAVEPPEKGIPEAWGHTARNSFFFAPDANERLQARLKPLFEELSVAEKLGIGDPKSIVYGNTRIILPRSDAGAVPPSPSTSHIAAAVAGERYHGSEPATPRVSGYGFVASMPSPSPGELGQQGLRKLMTRGRLAATPVILRGAGAEPESSNAPEEAPGGPRYDMPDTPRREMLAHKMASDASKSLQARHGGRMNLPQLGPRRGWLSDRQKSQKRDPSTPRPSDDLLSPAAKTLLGRTGAGRSESVLRK